MFLLKRKFLINLLLFVALLIFISYGLFSRRNVAEVVSIYKEVERQSSAPENANGRLAKDEAKAERNSLGKSNENLDKKPEKNLAKYSWLNMANKQEEKMVVSQENIANKPNEEVEENMANKKDDEFIDYTRCPGPFRVSVLSYKNESDDFWPPAKLLHDWLLRGNYFTPNEKLACLWVHLASGQSSENFHQMAEEGRNQLVIFTRGIVPIRGPGNRSAIFVASQFGYFQSRFDIHVETDVFDFDSKFWQKLPMVQSGRKRQLLSCFLVPENKLKMLNVCQNKKEVALSKAHLTLLVLNKQTMAKLPGQINKILLAGSVPLLLGGPNPAGPNSPLPFGHWIRWERALIWVPWERREQIDEGILGGIGMAQLARMRRFGRFLLEHHLANARVLVRSILSDIRMRLGIPAPPEPTVNLPQFHVIEPNNEKYEKNLKNIEPDKQKSAIVFEDKELWNQNPSYLDASPSFPMKMPSDLWNFSEDDNEKFTIVMQAFRRDAKLAYSLKRLNGLAGLDRVLVIWNNLSRPPPSAIFPRIHVPIFVLNGTRNSLNNRFLPLTQIHTEAVLAMNDDLDIGVNFQQKVLFMFRLWQQNRLRLVGPTFRLGQADYVGEPQCSFNLILTDIAFLNRAYLRAYSEEMSPAIRAHVDKKLNCEDIAMNFLVAHFTGQAPIKTFYIPNVKQMILPSREYPAEQKGLSDRREHDKDRSECVRLFTRIFGYNPNVPSRHRVDPLWDGQRGEQCMGGGN